MFCFRSLLLRFLILALLLRASIPAGYMPDMQALQDGMLRMVICTASGPQELLMDADGNTVTADEATRKNGAPHTKDDPRHPGTHHTTSCIFAVAAQSCLHSPPVVITPLTLPAPDRIAAPTACTASVWRTFQHPARAPPLPFA
jgi:hypothetical protein